MIVSAPKPGGHATGIRLALEMTVGVAVAGGGNLEEPVVDRGPGQAQDDSDAGQRLAEQHARGQRHHGQRHAGHDRAPHDDVDVEDGEICEHQQGPISGKASALRLDACSQGAPMIHGLRGM